MTFRPCASSGRILRSGRDLRALAAEPEHARDRVAPDVGVEHADRLALGLQRRGEVDGQGRLAHAALAGADADDVADARQRALGQPARAAERLLQAGLLLVGQHVEADADRGHAFDRAHRLVDVGLEMAFDRAAGGRQRDRHVDGPKLGDVNGTDHPELDDRAVELGVDDDLQRLEDLISRGHATYCRRTGLRGRQGRAARAAQAREHRPAARLEPARLEPERDLDLARGRAVGEHAEDRQVVRVQPLAERAQGAGVERRTGRRRAARRAARAARWPWPARPRRRRSAARTASPASAKAE